MPRTPGLLRDVVDLVLARHCVACQSPGRTLCHQCLGQLRRSPVVSRTVGLDTIAFAAAPYDGTARHAVIAYKEHSSRSLAEPLGELLARAVGTAMRHVGTRSATLVPIPQHRRSSRDFDAVGEVLRRAQRHLRAQGLAVVAGRLIVPASDYAPLKSLGREERAVRVEGAFAVTRRRVDRRGWPVIVVDDVVTTGSTVAEAVRTLAGAGIRTTGVAAIAATSSDRGRRT